MNLKKYLLAVMQILRIYKGLIKRITTIIWSRKLTHIGTRSVILSPLKIVGRGINIGANVLIQNKCWIEVNPLTGENKAELIIGDGCAIGHFNEIYATKSIIIEDNVLTADRVYISDNLHGYENPNIPIIKQPITQKGTVRIGEGSWLGVGVAVIGANIGKHCVIGANAVVTRDIPDYCVAVGIPAKVIKRYNFETKKWEKTNSDGSFMK